MREEIDTVAEAHENDAFARRVEMTCDAAGETCRVSLPDMVTDKPRAAKSPAEWAYERLILYIQNFEAQLDTTQEVAMGFAGGDAGVLRIEGMGFFEPDIVTFYGTDDSGTRMQLIQHVSQLSVILRALPKVADIAPPRRIGFRLAQELELS